MQRACGCTLRAVWLRYKLQALVYDILPSTTAVFSYAIGSRKLTDNEQFFVGAQTVVSLLQTTQITSDVCFVTDHGPYASSNKTKIVWIETELFFLPGVDAPHVYVRAWALGCFHSLISTQTPSTGLRHPGGRCRKAMLGVWLRYSQPAFVVFNLRAVCRFMGAAIFGLCSSSFSPVFSHRWY